MLKHKNILLFCVAVLVILSVLSFFFEVAWWNFLLLFLFWLVMTVWGSSDIRLGYFVKTYCNNPNEKERKIAISFDDGPHPMTEKVLDVLQQYQAKATFFCIGTQIEKYPEIFKRIIAEGHVVGNHSYSHSNRFGIFSTDKVTEEIRRTDALIEDLTGKNVLFFRPPFGVTNPRIARAAKATAKQVIGWNNRSLDTVIGDENKILERVKGKVAPGGIILLHDTSQKTVNVLEQLLLFLQSEKYDVIAIDKLLNLPAYEA
ncbi:peptidoglycan/xylan/chitin deacetylase (PgdA/CDA1 family) [Flavobacterium cauense R2A-7]|uniref:Peptidoglycan/xylan/chitin deacetylase (PgdA/CDA1 family) n=1 Tax=Flavobacterium cauense R2A-7 TaxID=1341154 RepID=A0A562LXH7_9FLAO|nr:polysaccharide deacetylase family protein [Flavobacterium cauense]KGO83727.1 polysaccharide deacetylase [Flavobacterium cauense R2A-7]TWI12340.1 peptidoglycan/xylan/chitin deacetylase (PgdA/CDA1 family) [Flavobacterium cauense R2A-7]